MTVPALEGVWLGVQLSHRAGESEGEVDKQDEVMVFLGSLLAAGALVVLVTGSVINL